MDRVGHYANVEWKKNLRLLITSHTHIIYTLELRTQKIAIYQSQTDRKKKYKIKKHSLRTNKSECTAVTVLIV